MIIGRKINSLMDGNVIDGYCGYRVDFNLHDLNLYVDITKKEGI